MITVQELSSQFGNFTWMFGMEFFIETPLGNFVWRDPDYGGDGSMLPFPGSYQDFAQGTLGRDKGMHPVGRYCGDFHLVPARIVS